MIALIRFQLATLAASQRFLGPLLLLAMSIAIFTSSDPGPMPPLYATYAGAVLAACCWLTMSVVAAQDPVRLITVVAAGGAGRVLVSIVLVSLVCAVGSCAIAVWIPLLVPAQRWTWADLLLGFLAMMTGALVGVGIGLLCSRMLIRRVGYALAAALGLVLGALFLPGLPPVNSLLRLMSRAAEGSEVLGSASGYLAVSAVVLALLGLGTWWRVLRKD